VQAVTAGWSGSEAPRAAMRGLSPSFGHQSTGHGTTGETMMASHVAKLALGGHSFIQELGNDPKASHEEQCSIVAACIDSGIVTFDTTHHMERTALGSILEELGRRDEAEIMAWNFFEEPGREHELTPYRPYQPDSIDIMLRELRTDRIDIVVIHSQDDIARFHHELELAKRWIGQGKARTAAIGMSRVKDVQALPSGHPVTHVLEPYSAFSRGALAMFELAREHGLVTMALSPFVRGWKLDAIGGDTSEVAGIALRWVTSQPVIDTVVVSMRRSAWVHTNLASASKGALTPEEEIRLDGWLAQIAQK